jgi:DNA-binding MarR family transcriptional regulator
MRGVLNALRRIVRDLRLGARDAERSAGISGAQLFVLQALADERASSLNELADRTHTDQSSVSVVVRRLVDRKLIARKAANDDARRTELSLTAAGRRLLARCPEPTQARLVQALERMPFVEFQALASGLHSLTHEMGGDAASPPMFFDLGARAQGPRRGESDQ